MEFLMQLLLKLCDMACWLCTKRTNVETRLLVERNLKGKGRR